MGSTFTNLQIYCGYEFDRNQVIDQVNKVLYDSGFKVVSEDHNADRTIVIKFSKQCPWVTMCGSFLESSSLDDLKSTVKDLSKALNKSVVGVSVFDSDVLAMYLNDVNLGLKDLVVCSDDDDLADEIGYNPNTTKGKLKTWVPFLKSDVDKKRLKGLFSGEYTFAEDRMADISEMLSMDKESVCSVNSDFIDNSSDNEDFYLMNLVYREGYKPPFEIVTNGLPAFSLYKIIGVHDTEIGSIQYYNTGGIGKGLRFVVSGECLKNYKFSSCEISTIRHNVYNPNALLPGDKYEGHKSVFKKAIDNNGNIYYVAEFEDFIIPEGIKINVEYEDKAPWKKIYDYIEARIICFHFKFIPYADAKDKKRSEDEIYISLIPYDNPISGKFTFKQKIANNELDKFLNALNKSLFKDN